MKIYSSSKQVLDRYGISITKDITRFTNTVKCIEEFGYDPEKVVREFNDIQYHQDKHRALRIAVDKFFRDIETQYDSKLGFEGEKERLNTQIRILEEEREKRLEKFKFLPYIGPSISRLMQLGLTENDIVAFAEVFLNILNKSFSMQDIARGILKTVEDITTGYTGTTSDDKSMEILGNVREELSKLDYT